MFDNEPAVEEKYTYTNWSRVNSELLVKLLCDHSFAIILNANDTFYYASADATTVDSEDIWKLLQVYAKYGDDGVLAFQAKIRDEEVLGQLITNKYDYR
jgi:hypothetical protein